MLADDALIVNGWCLLAHSLFIDQFEILLEQVEILKQRDPLHYKNKNAAKRLTAITKLIFEIIPNDPAAPEYRQGSALGAEHKHWFRAKFFQQYRLFFRYHLESKIIIYAWVNDENTLRSYENKSDAYLVFRKMLKNGNPPNDWESLLKETKKAAKHFKKSKNDRS